MIDPSFLLPSRRNVLKSLASGFGYLAFAGLAHRASAQDSQTKRNGLENRETHFPARAKRVIFLCMNGGPSHIDLFDYKPALSDRTGQKTANSVLKGNAGLMASPFKFSRHGDGIRQCLRNQCKQQCDLLC